MNTLELLIHQNADAYQWTNKLIVVSERFDFGLRMA